MKHKGGEAMPVVYFVVPCYNEEEALPETNRRLLIKLNQLIDSGRADEKSRILYVDDGSSDKTWAIIMGFHEENPGVCGLKLAHNAGHQNALLAGLMTARSHADCAISLDADLQDDIEVLDEFVDRYIEGCEVVYGVRNRRDTDTFFKRFTAESFYKLMKHLGVDVVFNHADYRLMGRRALDALRDYREVNLFLRGIVPLIGFKSGVVYYNRNERIAGESKYPFKKMLSIFKRHRSFICSYLIFCRGCRSGLDRNRRFDLAFGRNPAVVYRRGWRLYRQDIQRSKKQAKIYYRRVFG